MKKLFLFLLVVAGAWLMSSCAKEYNCTRTTSVNGVIVNTTIYTYAALTKEEKTDEENLNTYHYVDTDGDLIDFKTECN